MISNEMIAHELTIIYLNNRYGINVKGELNISTDYDEKVSGNGTIETEHFGKIKELEYVKVSTGEKYFKKINKFNLGPDKKEKVPTGKNIYPMDDIFADMVLDYKESFARFLGILNKD